MIIRCIPDVPKTIQDQIERENLITQRALWEAKPEINRNLDECVINREK
jgi:hypothetical protein